MGLLQQLAAEADGKAELLANYRKLMGLVESIAAGKVDAHSVKIDWASDSWTAATGQPSSQPPVRVVNGIIGEDDLIEELQNLDMQKVAMAENANALLQIDGAEKMVRHLLAKGHCRSQEHAKGDAVTRATKRNDLGAVLPETNGKN